MADTHEQHPLRVGGPAIPCTSEGDGDGAADAAAERRSLVSLAAHTAPALSLPPGELVLVAVGANLGERLATIRAAFRALQALPGTVGWRSSPVYETPPVGIATEPGEVVAPPFLNAVFAATTAVDARRPLSLEELFVHLRAVEQTLGRQHKGESRSRALDLDLLAVGRARRTEPELTVPHPRLAERWFVLAPLADVAPDWRHPDSGATVAEMLAALADKTDAAVGRGRRYAEHLA